MTAGMSNRKFVLDTIEEEGFDYLTEGDVNEAIKLLNTGKGRDHVVSLMDGWDADYRTEAEIDARASADFEERAYGSD